MKNKIFHFKVNGHPRGRQEPRKGKGGWYTPRETKQYYEHIRNAFQELYPRLNDRTHKWFLRVDISVNNKKYPDCSNVIKAVEDALQGCIWANDKQIWQVQARRVFIEKYQIEHIYVYAEMMEDL